MSRALEHDDAHPERLESLPPLKPIDYSQNPFFVDEMARCLPARVNLWAIVTFGDRHQFAPDDPDQSFRDAFRFYILRYALIHGSRLPVLDPAEVFDYIVEKALSGCPTSNTRFLEAFADEWQRITEEVCPLEVQTDIEIGALPALQPGADFPASLHELQWEMQTAVLSTNKIMSDTCSKDKLASQQFAEVESSSLFAKALLADLLCEASAYSASAHDPSLIYAKLFEKFGRYPAFTANFISFWHLISETCEAGKFDLIPPIQRDSNAFNTLHPALMRALGECQRLEAQPDTPENRNILFNARMTRIVLQKVIDQGRSKPLDPSRVYVVIYHELGHRPGDFNVFQSYWGNVSRVVSGS